MRLEGIQVGAADLAPFFERCREAASMAAHPSRRALCALLRMRPGESGRAEAALLFGEARARRHSQHRSPKKSRGAERRKAQRNHQPRSSRGGVRAIGRHASRRSTGGSQGRTGSASQASGPRFLGRAVRCRHRALSQSSRLPAERSYCRPVGSRSLPDASVRGLRAGAASSRIAPATETHGISPLSDISACETDLTA